MIKFISYLGNLYITLEHTNYAQSDELKDKQRIQFHERIREFLESPV